MSRRQTEATREQILNAGFEMLTRHPQDSLSHEALAKKAGMGARTVYRHFPSRSDLLQALWERMRAATGLRFPSAEEEVVPFIRRVFQQFEDHATMVRAVIHSSAGSEVRARGGITDRAQLAQSLSKVVDKLPARRRTQVIAVFLAIYSGSFWQTLRDRSGLSGPEAQEAAAWTLEALLNAVRAEAGTARQTTRRNGKKEMV